MKRIINLDSNRQKELFRDASLSIFMLESIQRHNIPLHIPKIPFGKQMTPFSRLVNVAAQFSITDCRFLNKTFM